MRQKLGPWDNSDYLIELYTQQIKRIMDSFIIIEEGIEEEDDFLRVEQNVIFQCEESISLFHSSEHVVTLSEYKLAIFELKAYKEAVINRKMKIERLRRLHIEKQNEVLELREKIKKIEKEKTRGIILQFKKR